MSMNRNDLEAIINSAEAFVGKLKSELQKMEESSSLRRVSDGRYFSIICDYYDGITIKANYDIGEPLDNSCYESGNYFSSRESAEEFLEKLKFLLKQERMKDIYCPNYTPDWEDTKSKKWYITYSESYSEYVIYFTTSDKFKGYVYFPDETVAGKVCDLLNCEKEIKHTLERMMNEYD